MTHIGVENNHVQILKGLCHAFASASSMREMTQALGRWIRATIHAEEVSFGLWTPDARGELQATHREGLLPSPLKDLRAARKAAYEQKSPAVIGALDGSSSIAILPLVTCGESMGILEVSAPTSALEQALETLEAIASQGSIVLRNLRDRAHLTTEVEEFTEARRLVRHLMRAETPEEALRAVVEYCWSRFQLPVVAWLVDESGNKLELNRQRGLVPAEVRAIAQELQHLSTAPGADLHIRIRESRTFGRIAGLNEVATIDAGDAVVFAGLEESAMGASLEVIQPLLEQLLTQFRTARRDRERDRRLDSGIALTAHEIKSPLLGTLAVMQVLEQTGMENGRNGSLLRQARKQLGELAELTDDLLQWTVGGQELKFETINATDLVDGAIRSCDTDKRDRIVLHAPAGIEILGDRRHLHKALGNLIGHAIRHTRDEAAVEVEVERQNSHTRITITDGGPPVSPEEQMNLFDPFARDGSAARSMDSLRLFAARRVIEAHDGTISLASDDSGATFQLDFPINGRSERSAHS